MIRLRLGITQRVELVDSYQELRDCLDQEWTKLLEPLGFDVILIPNSLSDPIGWLTRLKIDGVILTGGNDLSFLPNASKPSQLRDTIEKDILDWAGKHSVPVLGVCRGMQLINCYLGGMLGKIEGHVAQRHLLITKDPASIFTAYKAVNSFHCWGISNKQLASSLEVLAVSEDGVIEAYQHTTLPWLGIMWHPERDSPPSKLDKKLIVSHFNQGKD